MTPPTVADLIADLRETTARDEHTRTAAAIAAAAEREGRFHIPPARS